jgi:hypothetical protein
MASLLFPDDDPAAPTPLLQLPDERPPSLQPDPRADALGQTYKDITDYMAQQHQKGVDEGYWAGGGLLEGGHPTLKAFNSAADEYAQGLLMGTTSSGGKYLKAYHGSPHKFDQFSDHAIGTGEGAQAYGYGHYLAENEGVARGYRDALIRRYQPPEIAAVEDAILKEIAAGNEKAAVLEAKGFDFMSPEVGAVVAPHDQAVKALQDKLSAMPKPTGHMYEVNVAADPEKFLHWDKPLSEQHPAVRKALNDIGVAPPNASYTVRPVEGGHVVDYVDGNNQFSTSRVYKSAEDADRQASITMKMMNRDPTGAELVRQNQGIEAKLKDAGVPGIRYLDASSRTKEKGTHNAVIFDPATMEIIRRYGLAGLMLGGGGLLSPDKQEQ